MAITMSEPVERHMRVREADHTERLTLVKRDSGAFERLSGIHLNGSAELGLALSATLRQGGILAVDRDGVFTDISLQINEALTRSFKEFREKEGGVIFNYDFRTQDVYRMFGLNVHYNDRHTSIRTLMAINLEAQETGRPAADILRDAVSALGAVKILDDYRAKWDGQIKDEQFVMDNMYWRRENGGFMRSPEASEFAFPYKGAHGATSRDALIAAHEAGIPTAIITNAEERGLGDAGFKPKDKRRRFSRKGEYAHGWAHVWTKKEMGELTKPNPFGLVEAAKAHGALVERSVMVGDGRSDIEAAMNAGYAEAVLVESGMGQRIHIEKDFPTVRVAPDLPTVVASILRAEGLLRSAER